MELTELRNGLLDIFGVGDAIALGDAIMSSITTQDYAKFDACVELVGNDGLRHDFLQKIYQYHLANRNELSQDFTPPSLGKLIGALTASGDTCLDICAGSGALTIQAWAMNPARSFVCFEIDGTVIPYLIFNCAIRNMDAAIFHADYLAGEIYDAWLLAKSGRYSGIERVSLAWERDQQPSIQRKMEQGQGMLY